ncbi:MAG TPA: cytochrome c oxidase subunit II [Anaerolineales bacterium]|nr:cytochrome c oxidase subunit II [Anaerolineales bacterium]
MTQREKPQRVLIASSHALFGQGLRSLLQARPEADVEVVGIVSNLEEAISALDSLNPDLVIVDYDDERLNREEFLAHFVEVDRKLRVVLLSLQDGEEAIVYDRRTMAAAQIDDWLKKWSDPQAAEQPSANENVQKEVEAYTRRGNMKHLIIAGILVVVVTVLLIVGLGQVNLLPAAASAQAEPIDRMFDLEFKVIAFLFALIIVFMVYSIVVFRRKAGDTTDARHIEGNTRLEVAWTAIPLVTVLAFAYMGSQALGETQRIDPRAIEVNVVGSQWSWSFEYPELGIITDKMYLPVGQQALLHLSSADVIHSFWVPEFRVKQDALPGGGEFVRDLRITPTEIGEYKVRCAELCGRRHAFMESPVIVLSQADFDGWVIQETGLSEDPVERGEKWYTTFGCNACHSLDGTPGVGPSWQGLYESQRTLVDGSTVTADDAYIHEAIINPNAKVAQGFLENIMPQNFGERMSEAQIQDMIEFIKSLR